MEARYGSGAKAETRSSDTTTYGGTLAQAEGDATSQDPAPPASVTELGQLRMLSRIAEQVGEGVAVFDNDARLLYANPAFATMHGTSVEHLNATPMEGSTFYDADDWNGPVQVLIRAVLDQGVGRAEVMRRRLDGSTFAAHVTLSMLRDEAGELLGRVLCVQDVTERREANARLEALATTDVLTGLPNRALFADRLDQALAVGKREQRGVALLFIDLDRFKNVNDSLGHHFGDEVLVEVAGRLRGALRAGDTVARLGGDEFALLLAGSTSPEQSVSAAERVLASLRPSIVAGDVEFFVSASIGVALWPEDCSSKTELLQHADVAMYRAKSAGGNRFEMFQPAMTVAARERLRIEADLRRAIDGNEFFLRYQPQMDLRSGEVTGVEALVRWRHPARGEVTPAEFIALAEETALIVPIGNWVLEEACRQAARWREDLDVEPNLRMAVNIAPRQLIQPDFVRLVTRALDATATPPSQLELEITEDTILADTGPAVATLVTLRKLGVTIAIDDFGTGYSSLSYLRRFPVDRLKLDMSLVADIVSEGNVGRGRGSLVAAAINLAHALDLEAVAEGVENESQRVALAAAGCEQAQGYLWSKPLLASEIPPWLAEVAPNYRTSRSRTTVVRRPR